MEGGYGINLSLPVASVTKQGYKVKLRYAIYTLGAWLVRSLRCSHSVTSGSKQPTTITLDTMYTVGHLSVTVRWEPSRPWQSWVMWLVPKQGRKERVEGMAPQAGICNQPR